MSVAVHELREFVACLLVEAGAGADAAAQTAASLIEADARNHGSHGVSLVAGYAERLRDGRLDSDGAPEIVSWRRLDARDRRDGGAEPRLATTPAAFAEHVEEVVAEVKRGNPGVLVPGEAGAIAAASAAARVRIPTATWARLAALAEEHGIEIPSVEEEQ